MTLRERLDLKRKELEERQNGFKLYVDIHLYDDSFESNAINDLLTMMKLKAEIKVLELELALSRI